jgi:hypothetical protein
LIVAQTVAVIDDVEVYRLINEAGDKAYAAALDPRGDAFRNGVLD